MTADVFWGLRSTPEKESLGRRAQSTEELASFCYHGVPDKVSFVNKRDDVVKSFFLSPLFIVKFQGLQETSSYPKILLRKASAYKLGCERKYLFLDFDMYLKLF